MEMSTEQSLFKASTEVFCTPPCLKDHIKHFALDLTYIFTTKALLTSHHANT